MPDNSDDHYKRGLDFFQNNQFNEAIAEFQKAIKIKSDHSGSYLHLGLSYKQKGQFNEAIQEFQKYLKLNPKDIECRKDLIFLYLDLEKYESAIGEFNEIIRADKSDFEFFSQFGLKLSKSDDEKYFDAAKMCLELANKINPADVKSRIGLLEFYLNSCALSKDDEIKFLKELLEIDPSNIKVIMKIAVTYGFFDNRRIEKKCITALKENLEKNPDKIQACADFTFAMLAAYEEQGCKRKELLNETIKSVPELLDKQPNSNNKVLIQAYTDLAYTYGRLGLKEGERETWEKIIRFASDFKILGEVDFIDNITYCYESQGKLAKLARFYQQVLRSDGLKKSNFFIKNGYHLNLGLTYVKLKKYYCAKDELEKIANGSREWKPAQDSLQKVNQEIRRIELLEQKVDRFERELRVFIETQLLKNNWDFDREKKNINLLKKIDSRIKEDQKKIEYLSDDDINPLDYCQLFECLRIMEIYWKDSFHQIFPDKDELEKKIGDIANFRNAVKHNRSIEDPIIGYCEGSVDWILKMMEKESRI